MVRRLLPLIFLLAAIGCHRDGETGTSTSKPSVLIYGRESDARGLDPIHASVGETVKVLVNIYDTLVAYDDETLDLVPSLAESWTTSEDGLVWTFRLREGVRFHDGTPFDAEAVVFTFERLLMDDHPHVHHGVPPYRPHFAMIESVSVVDDLTVEFQLKQRSAVFFGNLSLFGSGIVSPAAVKKHGRQYATHPAGTGPFRLKSWKRKQELVLEAYDDHWRGRAGVDVAIFVPVEESSIRVQQLKRGEIHIADNLPPPEVDALIGAPNVEVQQHNGMNVCYITFQTEKPPLNNPKVRHAISHAINKKDLIKVAYGGHALPAENMMPPTIWGHLDEVQGRRAHDMETARKLLQAASREDGFQLPLKLKLFVMGSARPYIQQPRPVGVFVKDTLAEIGIEIEIITSEVPEYFRRLSAGEHELGLSGWSSDTTDPDSFLYSLLHSSNISDDGGNNLSRYKNPEVDRLLEAAQAELDQDGRADLYRQAQQLIYHDAPTIPLVHTNVRIVLRSEVKGYKLHPSSMVRLRKAYFEGSAP